MRTKRLTIATGIAALIAGVTTVVGAMIVEATRGGSPSLAAPETRAAPATPPPAAPTPTLREILIAADDLVRAGAIAPPAPSLSDVLVSIDALVRAGRMAPLEPTLGESVLAAAQLEAAGLLPPEAKPRPPLSEVLQAVALLSEARQQALAPPPAAQVEPPRPLPTAPPLPPPATATPAPPPPAPAASGPGWYDAGYTATVFQLVNARRAAAGLGQLSSEPRLTSAAAAYAKLLSDSDTFSHTGPDGSTLVSRVEAAGFPFDVQVGEVLALGTGGWTAEGVVQAWMDSASHREQLLGPYTRAGASCYFLPDAGVTVRCVIEFAG